MAPLVSFKTILSKKGDSKTEILRIDQSKQSINGRFRVFTFRDKDTRQIVCYIPSLDVSGYGATEKKAKELLKFTIDQQFKYLFKLSQKKRDAEIRSLGLLVKHS